jgi:REP element-mobilizing transposase RayT
MPERDHLHRLRTIWIKNPVYFLTVCTAQRRKILAGPITAAILVESWHAASNVHGWAIGRYVIMPDHVHFFASTHPESKSLSAFMRDWKKWTARRIAADARINSPIWQLEFFDHVLRSARSYSEKWDYVRQNPVRAGLADSVEAWAYAGECVALDR